MKRRRQKEVERHGQSKTLLYKTWADMCSRCRNANHHSYSYYGARGITVCDRWSRSFMSFLEDMGNKPTPEHTIDRIDNNGNYEPANCKWSTRAEQLKNRRKPMARGGMQPVGISGIHWSTLRKRWIITNNERLVGYALCFFDACCLKKSAELHLQMFFQERSQANE